METKDLNAKKYLELAGNIYSQAFTECKELLRSRGDKCYIYVTFDDTDNIIYLDGDGDMAKGWILGVGLNGDDLLYCAYPFNDTPGTIEDPWQSFKNYGYLCFESLPEVYSFIVEHLNESVTKEEAVAIQEKDYDEHDLKQKSDFSFDWDLEDEDEENEEDED